MKVNFAKFQNSLPYASELYGIYQPLLGWRSRIRTLELARGVSTVKRSYLKELQGKTKPDYELAEAGFNVRPGKQATGRSALDAVDSIVARKVGELAAKAGFGGAAWHKYTSEDALKEVLSASKDDIQAELKRVITARYGEPNLTVSQASREDINAVLSGILDRESRVAGALRRLGEERSPEQLAKLMNPFEVQGEKPFLDLIELVTPAHSDLVDATISPIGLVRLYRQYFFEFDTFLGPAVQHLWLSPGGVVELVETSTRRTLVERSTEQAFESIEKSEKSSTDEDDLSSAVRDENSANTKLGVTFSSTGTYGVAGFIEGSATLGSSFDEAKSSKDAREKTHRTLRQQTEKLSSEIRKSFKSTFKTATETTDTQSRRYVISNTTQDLINYELRRKMRQVGVQVQDYGLQLCWQAYVDKPGDELGIAKLVHIAAPADLQGVKEPDAQVMPDAEIRDKPFPLHGLRFGVPEGSNIGPGFIRLGGNHQLTPPKQGYIYSRAEVVRTSDDEEYTPLRAYPETFSEPIEAGPHGLKDPPQIEDILTGDAVNSKERSVRSIAIGWMPEYVTQGDGHNYFWDVDVTVIWRPSQQHLKSVEASYATAMLNFSAAKERAFREAMYTAARDRVKVASKIEPRPFEELREEERIIIYRNLIRKLLEVAGITNEDPKLRHVFAELVQSMFDVDKMLYFVAPEWWMPRQVLNHFSRQRLGLHGSTGMESITKTLGDFDRTATVNWGGAGRLTDYYITEDSTRARLGSSLGWLLQLDGDNLRNAFLNAPWVKAVIPIRAGHEWKALGWLSSDAIEGSDGLEDNYQATDAAEKPKILAALKAHVWDDPTLASLYASMTDPNKVRIIDAIRYLIVHLQERHTQSLKAVPNPDDATMNYLPTDEVFERGFDPLPGGFKAVGTEPFKVFDQWIEVLPTDQIVPVEVEYDPKTGMQI
jgi:hypothetical protein